MLSDGWQDTEPGRFPQVMRHSSCDAYSRLGQQSTYNANTQWILEVLQLSESNPRIVARSVKWFPRNRGNFLAKVVKQGVDQLRDLPQQNTEQQQSQKCIPPSFRKAERVLTCLYFVREIQTNWHTQCSWTRAANWCTSKQTLSDPESSSTGSPIGKTVANNTIKKTEQEGREVSKM